jgi:hypothetical protein
VNHKRRYGEHVKGQKLFPAIDERDTRKIKEGIDVKECWYILTVFSGEHGTLPDYFGESRTWTPLQRYLFRGGIMNEDARDRMRREPSAVFVWRVGEHVNVSGWESFVDLFNCREEHRLSTTVSCEGGGDNREVT